MEAGIQLSLRQLCNIIYAHLVAGADQEGRAELDSQLNDWGAAERRFFTRLAEEAG